MALTMFWRCEGATLDGTHDYNAYGSVTASLVSGALINSDAARIGTNSIDAANSGNDYVSLPAAALSSIFSNTAGTIAFWFRASAWASGTGLFDVNGTSGDFLRIRPSGSSNTDIEFEFYVGSNGSGEFTVATTSVNGGLNTWYFVVVSWQSSGMRIRVYDNSLSLLQEATNATLTLPIAALGTSCTIGTWDAGGRHFIDNIFVGNAYADADTFVTKATITSYTEYSGAAASTTSHFMGFGGRMIG